jgi:hypothetical protein
LDHARIVCFKYEISDTSFPGDSGVEQYSIGREGFVAPGDWIFTNE